MKTTAGDRRSISPPSSWVIRAPHFYLDGQTVFLGIRTATTIDISDKGVKLNFTSGVGSGTATAFVSVAAELDNIKNFDFDFKAGVHIDDPELKLWKLSLGHIPIKLDIDCELSFGAKEGNLFLQLKETPL